jgi:hypothetical protein
MTARAYKENDLSVLLKSARQRQKLSTTDVQDLTSQWTDRRLKISQGFLSQAEKGATPSPYKLLGLVRIYKITIAAIFRAIGANDEEIGVGIEPALAPNVSDALCSDATHRTLQTMLDEMLHSPPYDSWISANVINLHAGMKRVPPDLSLVVNGEAKQVPASIPEPTVKVTHGPKK